MFVNEFHGAGLAVDGMPGPKSWPWLQRITRTAKDPVLLRRAIVVLMSGQGQAVRLTYQNLDALPDQGCVTKPLGTV
jgi:hypothetical protein